MWKPWLLHHFQLGFACWQASHKPLAKVVEVPTDLAAQVDLACKDLEGEGEEHLKACLGMHYCLCG